MANTILVLNAGSSSLKCSLFAARRDELDLLMRGQAEALLTTPHFVARDAKGKVLEDCDVDGAGHEAAAQFLLDWIRKHVDGNELCAAGHRVVHGGRSFCDPVRIDASVLASLESLTPLAPLHQPHNLSAIRAVAKVAPKLPQVACFDTAFHRSQPMLAQQFAIPRNLTDEGVLRYGFHGISFEYVASILPQIDARAASRRTVVAHLGNGASLCAMRAGRSIATTMSFTPLDGLMMGTRCGSIDPGVLLYLMRAKGMSVAEVEQLLYEDSGLKGVSGLSSDMRALLASDDSRAREAIDMFVYRTVRELGSMAAALGGIDALVFTGGIGENAASIRARVCLDSSWLGITLDESANARQARRISTSDSCVPAWVIPTNEELMIARHTRRVLNLPH